LLFFFLCANLVVGGMDSHAATILVGPGHSIKSIKEALAVAQAHDTIRVTGGTYTEGNIDIRIPVTLLGIDRPVIDGQKKYEPVSIYSSDVTVRGFKISNSGHSAMSDVAAVKIYGQRNVTVEDN